MELVNKLGNYKKQILKGYLQECMEEANPNMLPRKSVTKAPARKSTPILLELQKAADTGGKRAVKLLLQGIRGKVIGELQKLGGFEETGKKDDLIDAIMEESYIKGGILKPPSSKDKPLISKLGELTDTVITPGVTGGPVNQLADNSKKKIVLDTVERLGGKTNLVPLYRLGEATGLAPAPLHRIVNALRQERKLTGSALEARHGLTEEEIAYAIEGKGQYEPRMGYVMFRDPEGEKGLRSIIKKGLNWFREGSDQVSSDEVYRLVQEGPNKWRLGMNGYMDTTLRVGSIRDCKEYANSLSEKEQEEEEQEEQEERRPIGSGGMPHTLADMEFLGNPKQVERIVRWFDGQWGADGLTLKFEPTRIPGRYYPIIYVPHKAEQEYGIDINEIQDIMRSQFDGFI
jgi:hypothetical protein